MADDAHDDDLAWCPECGAEVYLDANRCPACERYITPTLRRRGSRLWIAAVALVTLAAVLYLILSGMW
jgi:predicted amidophosphoribosyltransferase